MEEMGQMEQMEGMEQTGEKEQMEQMEIQNRLEKGKRQITKMIDQEEMQAAPRQPLEVIQHHHLGRHELTT